MKLRTGIKLLGVCAMALSLTGGTAAAKPGKSNGKQLGKVAAKACAEERATLGNEAFEELYGSPATPNCIGVKGDAAAPIVKGASKSCKAERTAIGADAFNAKYGKNKNKKNAFGKCVSAKSGKKAGQAVAESTEKVVNASQQCKAEQADPNFAASHGGKTFDEFYGTNPNLRNSFGKCVSTKAQAPAPTPTA